MRKLLLASALLCISFVNAKAIQPINPIIGDLSFLMRFGQLPNESTDDQLRISTHLAYAEFLLRSRDVSGMPESQRVKRNATLDLLLEYVQRGSFPHNYDYPLERRPCFIDGNGNICAVGYLIQETAGRELAELINARHKYERILEMNDALVFEWISGSGLTPEECAIIQPSYSETVSHSFSYGVSYRVNDNLYHTFGIHKLGKPYGNKAASYGVQFDWLRHGNFSAGIHYTKRFTRNQQFITPELGFSPEVFRYSNTWGMNMRPEFALVYKRSNWIMNLSYDYLIPVIAERKYGAGRHAFALRIGYIYSRTTGRPDF